jgi:hypothetical protein
MTLKNNTNHITAHLTNRGSTGNKFGYEFIIYLTGQQQNKTAIKPHADSRVRQFKPNDVSGAVLMETVSVPETSVNLNHPTRLSE